MSVASAAPPVATPATRRRPGRRMVLALVLAAALATGAAYAGLQPAPAERAPALTAGDPIVLPPGAIAAVARQVGHPVYGAPARAGSRLEVTRGTRGEVWVRYLVGAARAGDDRAQFLTVGTYPVAGALEAARRAAKGAATRSAPVPGGGLMLWNVERPTSVYLAHPGSSLLVEVYSPDAEQARSLARGGAVVPIR